MVKLWFCFVDVHVMLLAFPKRQVWDSIKLKEFADNNLKFDKNSGKSKRIVKTLGEPPRFEQFLLFPQCLQKICTADM